MHATSSGLVLRSLPVNELLLEDMWCWREDGSEGSKLGREAGQSSC